MDKSTFKSENTIIVNATNIGYKFHGIGVYSLNLLKELCKLKTDLNFIIYVNNNAASHLNEINFPENFMIKWVSKSLSPDYGFRGHIKRLFFSNWLSLKYSSFLIFNTSQLEINFFRAEQVITIHDIIPLLFKKYHKKQYLYYRFLLKFGLKRARFILTPSNFSKKTLQNIYKIPDSKIRVIHNGADTAGRKENINFEKSEKPFLLYIGRICKMKNIKGVIESFGKVAGKIPHNLIIVGNNEISFIEEFYFAKIDHNLKDRIIYKENISEAEKHYLFKNAAMMIFPTFYEGFGLPPIEAMAYGCPVIVSNNSSLPEICGDAAYYINPQNLTDISEAILKLIDNPELRNTLITKGKERALHFKWNFSARKHLWILEQIALYSNFPSAEKQPFYLPAIEPVGNKA